MRNVFYRNARWMALIIMATVLSCRKNTNAGSGSGIYSDPQSLFSLINANYNLSHYDTALIFSGYDSILAGKGSFTAFVVQDGVYPTGGNFGSLTGNTTYATSNNFYTSYYYQYVQYNDPGFLKRLTGYHILPLNLRIEDIPFAMNTGYPTLAGDSVYISKYIDPNSAASDTIVTVNGIKVVRSDFTASNGSYHVLDQLLFPPPDRTTWTILSGSNPLSWDFEVPSGITGPYGYALFTAALARTGLDQLLKGALPYTLLAVPDANFVDAYSTYPQNFTLDQIRNMDIDTLTRIMKQHILKGRYFLQDFQSYPYNGNIMDTAYNPAFGTYTYSAPIAFPTIGGDSLYVIPKGTQFGSGIGLWLFGSGNLLYSPYTSLYQNNFASTGVLDYIDLGYFNDNTVPYQPQDVVAPNGVIQFLYKNELVPR